MKTIWKYQLNVEESQEIEMPVGAKVLSVGNKNDILCLWALVDVPNDISKIEKAKRMFYIFGTGLPADGSQISQFIGTVVFKNGFVVHVFEANER